MSFLPFGKGGGENGFFGGWGMKFFNIKGGNSIRGKIKPEGGELLTQYATHKKTPSQPFIHRI